MAKASSIGRIWFLTWTLSGVLLALGVRLVFVQCVTPLTPGRGEDTERRIVRPALRGAILDVHGELLAHSRFVCNLRADPVVIGTNAAVFARFLAPLLEMSEAQLLPLLSIQPEWREQRYRRLETNGMGEVTTHWVGGYFTNRSVLVREQMELDDWDRIRERIRSGFRLPALEGASDRYRTLRAQGPDWKEKLEWIREGRLGELDGHRAQVMALRKHNEGLLLQQKEIAVNGVVSELVERRVYPLGGLAAHVLGHTREGDPPQRGLPPVLEGELGVERRFDVELQGSLGHLVTRRAKGRELLFLREQDADAYEGLNVRLTLDARIQSVVEEALDEGMARLSAKALTCVVVRPATGEILALANRPTFDPNLYRYFPVEHRMNRAITVPTEPGSTFKMVTYAAALDLGLVRMHSLIDCEHGIWSPPSGRPVRDVEGHGLSVVTLEEAFAKSSNVAAAKLGLQIPLPTLREYMKRLGYLQRTGILYHEGKGWGGEFEGRISGENRVNIEAHGRLSYGYNVYATPLQTVMAASAIANDGVLMKPMLVRSLETAEGRVVHSFQPEAVGRAMRPEVALELRRAMRRAVVDGTAKAAALPEFEVAGKTGTTHKVDPATRRQSTDKYVSTFVGFFPADQPELCILVLADEPLKNGRGSHYGGNACGPIFKKVAQQSASRLGLIPPDMPWNEEVIPNWAQHLEGGSP
jgi:cell division protein FtsI/penicillin-binding protein 2